MTTVVLLLHHDLERTEKRLLELLPGDDLRVVARDVRCVRVDEVRRVDLVLNRVYASAANRDFGSVRRALELCEEAEAAGVACLNSAVGCRADYDKAFAAARMRADGVATPATLTLQPGPTGRMVAQIVAAMDQFCGPVVFKRNTGGRGKDVLLIRNCAEAREVVVHVLAQRSAYPGHWIIQEYARNNRGHDCRIAVAGGQVLYAFGRSLVKGDSADPEPWLASVSRGSTMFAYQPDAGERELAIRASEVVGAELNELDIGFTSRGPIIIENNPTPQFVEEENPGNFAAFVAATRSALERRSLQIGRASSGHGSARLVSRRDRRPRSRQPNGPTA